LIALGGSLGQCGLGGLQLGLCRGKLPWAGASVEERQLGLGGCERSLGLSHVSLQDVGFERDQQLALLNLVALFHSHGLHQPRHGKAEVGRLSRNDLA
jgi:hypothetical protein